MPRIRTIKPDFFRHETLQDLEKVNPYIMLVFAGLWTISDKNGVFIYSPRTIKLDILPFLDFDMQEKLTVLENNGFIQSYEHEGKKYGKILSFVKHQRIQGKEFSEEGKYPNLSEYNRGNIGETSGNSQGTTGREEEGKGKGMECVEGKGNNKEAPTHTNGFDFLKYSKTLITDTQYLEKITKKFRWATARLAQDEMVNFVLHLETKDKSAWPKNEKQSMADFEKFFNHSKKNPANAPHKN